MIGALLAFVAVATSSVRSSRGDEQPTPPAPSAPPPAVPAPSAPPRTGESATGPASSPAPAASRAAEAAWLSEDGTALLGFGLLRVAPPAKDKPGEIEIRYEEKPSGYGGFDAVQLMVLPGDGFEKDGRCFADASKAWSRSVSRTYRTTVRVPVTKAALWVVGYGPYSGTDTGRPLTLDRAYTLDVKASTGTSYAWVDAEAGELTVKAWTRRETIERGGPVVDPVTHANHWFEVRPEILYDRERLRAPRDPETPETQNRRREADTLRARSKTLAEQGKADAAAELLREADDIDEVLRSGDDRLPVPAALAERMRRLPFRWK